MSDIIILNRSLPLSERLLRIEAAIGDQREFLKQLRYRIGNLEEALDELETS